MQTLDIKGKICDNKISPKNGHWNLGIIGLHSKRKTGFQTSKRNGAFTYFPVFRYTGVPGRRTLLFDCLSAKRAAPRCLQPKDAPPLTLKVPPGQKVCFLSKSLQSII